MKNHNDWEPDQAGTLKLAIIQNNWGSNKALIVNQINRYIDFLKRNRTSEESMDKYVRNLREETVNLSRKLWTLDELIAIKSYEVLNATT